VEETMSVYVRRRPDHDLTTRELTAQLGDQLSRLVRDEIALAKTELTVSARQAGLGAGMVAVAATCAALGTGVMVAAARSSATEGHGGDTSP
jgi:hypothetical protein